VFLSEGLSKWPDVLGPSPNRARLSWSCTTLQSFCPQLTSAGIGCGASLLPFDPTGWAPGFSPAAAAGRCPNVHHRLSSHGLVCSFRVHRASSCRSATVPSRFRSDVTAPPMRFAPLQRFPARGSSIVAWLASPGRLHPQVFPTSRRFSIHREPAGLISCRIRSWGCTLQSFAPVAWPYAVSGADPLLALVPARHHLDIPFPLAPAETEISSCPDGGCSSVGAEAPSGKTAAAHPAEAEAPTNRTVARPSSTEAPVRTPKRSSVHRSTLRAEQWLHSPGPKPLRAERSPDLPAPKHLPAELRPPWISRRSSRAGRTSDPRRPKPLRAERPSASARSIPESTVRANRTPARSSGAEAPSDETSCPRPAVPKSHVTRTSARSP
jgi:hypothetical protein